MPLLPVIGLLFTHAAFTPLAHASTDWETLALQMTGESEQIHRDALKALRKQGPTLVDALKIAVQDHAPETRTRRALALDVIGAVPLPKMLPILWQETTGEDYGAQALLTALQLSPDKTEAELRTLTERLWLLSQKKDAPLPTRVVATEALGRLYVTPPTDSAQKAKGWTPEQVRSFLAQPPILRWIFLGAWRLQLLKSGTASDWAALEPFLKDANPQIRTRAEILVANRRSTQLDPKWKKDQGSELNATKKTQIFFGYKDARPARYVADRIEALQWVSTLQKKGWRWVNFKTQVQPWEMEHTASGRRAQVWIASVGADDAVNQRDPYQDFWSTQITRTFQRAVEIGTMPIHYVGHSRDGGGPDFAPPLLDANDHVWYTKYHHAALLQKLGAQIPFLGLYSCSSQEHFEKWFHNRFPSVRNRLVSGLVYWNDALQILDQELLTATAGAR